MGLSASSTTLASATASSPPSECPMHNKNLKSSSPASAGECPASLGTGQQMIPDTDVDPANMVSFYICQGLVLYVACTSLTRCSCTFRRTSDSVKPSAKRTVKNSWLINLKVFNVTESITYCSRLFHLLTTRSEKKWCLISKQHRFFINLAWVTNCSNTGSPVFRVKKVSNDVVDHPLYILKTSRISASFLLSSSVHKPRHSNPSSYGSCFKPGIILTMLYMFQ